MKDSDYPIFDFSHWYVVSTFAGSEKKTIEKIKTFQGNNFTFYLPQKEFIHKKRGIEIKITLPLFPGYFFINHEYKKLGEINDFLVSANLGQRAHLLSADNKYLQVAEHEMELLFSITGEKGIIPLSHYVLTPSGKVEITRGPLKNLPGKILFINQRKKKAKVCLSIMNKDVYVTLGLEKIQA